MIITLLLSVLVPVIFLILLLVKGGKKLFLPWLFGALGFFVPQIVIYFIQLFYCADCYLRLLLGHHTNL